MYLVLFLFPLNPPSLLALTISSPILLKLPLFAPTRTKLFVNLKISKHHSSILIFLFSQFRLLISSMITLYKFTNLRRGLILIYISNKFFFVQFSDAFTPCTYISLFFTFSLCLVFSTSPPSNGGLLS